MKHPLSQPPSRTQQSRKDLDFSFAGLKNSFRMAVTKAVEEEDARNAQAAAGDGESEVCEAFVYPTDDIVCIYDVPHTAFLCQRLGKHSRCREVGASCGAQ